MNTEDRIKAALKDLERIANLSLSEPLRESIDKAVHVLCAQIAMLEAKCEVAFDAGWAACDKAHQAVEELETEEVSDS